MDSKERLKELICKYKEYKKNHNSSVLSEEETRIWINQLLGVFNWDLLNTQQIKQESIIGEEQRERLAEIDSSHIKPDYSLVNGNTVKAYLDAKKPDVNIFKNKDAAFQVRSYGWSAGLSCSFLTNFEQFVIFDCRYVPKKGDAVNVGSIQISMDHYLDEFEILNNHLNRSLVYQNNLQKIYKSSPMEGTQAVDELFNKLLSDFRLILANNMYKNNKSILNEDELNYYVQVILDRIIFIRVCESKGIEKEGTLLWFLKKGFWENFRNSCYVEFYNHYDGAMFSKKTNDKIPNIDLDDSIFEGFIRQLYYPYPYKFNVIPTKIIAKVYEDFLAYSLCIKNEKVEISLKDEYVKTNGAVPTPEYIADAICRETFSELTIKKSEDIFNLRVLDPCCGSGIFLISAYEFLSKSLMTICKNTNKWCLVTDKGKVLKLDAKRKIMKSCLFGIDCDPTATEVTKMSLALKMIDDIEDIHLLETGVFGDKILSDIHNNIVIGNTLIDTDISCPPTEIKYIRPLCIKNQVYKKVFEEKGGFDYIIGNPPYVETKFFKAASPIMHDYLRAKYVTFEGKVDLSVLFIERAMDLLNQNGSLGMIIQRRWFKTNYGRGARQFVFSGSHLKKLLDIETNSLFKGRITYVSIMILSKAPSNEVYYDRIKGDPNDVQAYFDNPKELASIDSSYFTPTIWAPELKSIFEIKNKCAIKFGTIGENTKLAVRDGIQALWKKAYDITDYSETNGIITGKNGLGEIVKIEKGILKPIIYNRVFKPLKKLSPDAYRIFPYYGVNNKTKMSITYIKSHYPLAHKYLVDHETVIKENVRCNAGKYWPTYTREHNHDSFNSAKIVIPMTTKETYATFENTNGFYLDNSNVWFINHNEADTVVMKALTMIINSTIFSVLAKSGANQASNGYYKFNKQFIEPVPVPNTKMVSSDDTIIKLNEMYDEIIQILQEYENATQRDDELFKRILEQKWIEVDDICYDFYELTAEEKNLIEGLGRLESRVPGSEED